MGPAAVYECCDTTGRGRHILVLPHPDDCPAVLEEPTVRVFVPFLVLTNLLDPVGSVDARDVRSVQWAAMPEAPIDVHGDATWSEGDIRAPPRPSDDLPFQAEAKPEAVQLTTQAELRSGVPVRLSLHALANGRRRGKG